MLYEELLGSCQAKLQEFLQNTNDFDNHFIWSDYNEKCYECMYTNNQKDNIKEVNALKGEISELKELCKKCGDFFLKKRNESIPKYDVVLGKQLEDAIMDFLSAKLETVVDRADLDNRSMPDCKVMRADGSAAAYLEIKFHGAPFIYAKNKIGRYCYEGSATLDLKKIEKQLEINETLDAPVYYVHWIEYPCLKGVFYETSEQLKQYMSNPHETFERKEREGDKMKSPQTVYLGKLYSPLLEMKSFEALIDELRSLI